MQIEPTWWITAVEAPIVGALFWMIHGLRRDLHERMERADQRESEAVARTREDLAEFKLEVARTYVPLSLIREVDRRLSAQLLRIEEKLEAVNRAAASRPRAGLGLGDER
ncbi:hypothetical protein [Crenalkalicoccus roseus]|jgi:FKBP-type peptidyl-prolyl cis-trans isomerase (trigger factor)|uniref:hypothetical protein n=1 Tax=Crenalkalicoccus roseus TaxID=1485588 RepID=UPI0010802653|nr:hypothetical protein [Crenalkalicoccus roseus]